MITKTLFVLYSPFQQGFVGRDDLIVNNIEDAMVFQGLAEAEMAAIGDEEVIVMTISYELPKEG